MVYGQRLLLQNKGDIMQNCVLMVGNGFSISLLRATGLSDKIALGSILPPDDSVRYLPFVHDPIKEQPLWDEVIWPRLWKEYYSWKTSAGGSTEQYEFFGHLARKHSLIFTDSNKNLVRVENFQHITYELRYYLWQLFKYYDQVWNMGRGREKVQAWDWWTPLRVLAYNTNLTVISFNYDCFFDSTLFFQGKFGLIGKPGRLLFHPRNCGECLSTRQRGDVVLLKPHGSMMWDPSGGVSVGQNPWLSPSKDLAVARCSLGRIEYPVTDRWVFVPDLVPPGHNEKHLIDMDTDVFAAIRRAIAQCDALILCGLRAGEPDTPEVDRYLSNLRYGTPAFHIDPRLDSPAGGLLRRYSPTGYKGLDISQAASIDKLVLSLVPRT